MKKTFYIISIIFLLGLSGCQSGKLYRFTDKPTNISTNEVSINFDTNCSMSYYVSFCRDFTLSITNKTNSNIVINWNKTYYVRSNQTQGGFMYGGIQYVSRNNPRQNDVIFPNGSYTQKIFPNNLVDYSSASGSGWYHKSIPLGVNGIYLTLIINGKEVEYKLNSELKEKLVLDN